MVAWRGSIPVGVELDSSVEDLLPAGDFGRGCCSRHALMRVKRWRHRTMFEPARWQRLEYLFRTLELFGQLGLPIGPLAQRRFAGMLGLPVRSGQRFSPARRKALRRLAAPDVAAAALLPQTCPHAIGAGATNRSPPTSRSHSKSKRPRRLSSGRRSVALPSSDPETDTDTEDVE